MRPSLPARSSSHAPTGSWNGVTKNLADGTLRDARPPRRDPPTGS